MYNKLHSRKNHVLLNILLCLPVLILLAGFVLSREKIIISPIPFKVYLLYNAAAFISALLFYKILIPLHEIGHYQAALYFKKKHHLDVDIWMDKKNTFCSEWSCYGNKEEKLILCAGMLFKFAYCIGIILIFAIMNIKSGMITFIYAIWFEIVLNALPTLEEPDGYKFIHIDAFYNEKIKEPDEKEESFVKRVYPWLLAVVTFVTIVLFGFLDKGLELLLDFL